MSTFLERGNEYSLGKGGMSTVLERGEEYSLLIDQEFILGPIWSVLKKDVRGGMSTVLERGNEYSLGTVGMSTVLEKGE